MEGDVVLLPEEERRPVIDPPTFKKMMSQSQDLLTIREEESDPKFGSEPHKRSLSDYLNYGIIILDKPQGPTSHQVAAWVRKMLNLEKAGYSGTLDPPVSGILPVGLGDATKALTVLLFGPKEYVAVARIHDSVPDQLLRETISQFTGSVYQKPPQRSSVRRATRTRHIYELEILEKFGNLLLLRVLCEAGTYVRKLVYDIGEVLAVGATMAELRRTRVCQFGEDVLVRLQDLFESKANYEEKRDESGLRRVIRPVEEALNFLPKIIVRDSAVESICQGAQLAVPGILSLSKALSKGDFVGLFTSKGEIIAIAEAQMAADEIRTQEHGIAALTRRVIMKQGTYPRMWKTKGEAETLSEEMLKDSILGSINTLGQSSKE